jgi:hypothetical protein
LISSSHRRRTGSEIAVLCSCVEKCKEIKKNVRMSNEQRFLQFLTNETVAVYGLTEKTFHFSGGDFYELFSLRVKEIEQDRNILTPVQQREYMKCYAVAVGSIINKWYKRPDTREGEEFQTKFFQERVLTLCNFYEKDPQGNFFKVHKDPPTTEAEEVSIANYLIQKAKWVMEYTSRDYFTSFYKKRCIDYPAYKEARTLYNEMKDKEPTLRKPTVDDFRDSDCAKEIEMPRDSEGEFIDIADTYTTEDLDHLDEYFLIPGKSKPLTSTPDIEVLISRLQLDHSSRIKRLFDSFSPNDIREMVPSKMWEINHIQPDMKKTRQIFHHMSLGHTLNNRGKQFLLQQYLTIAVAVFTKYDRFSIADSGVTEHSRAQMKFLATVIAKTYVHFNNSYEKEIIDALAKLTNNEAKQVALEGDNVRLQKLFRIISEHIEKVVSSGFSDYKKVEPMLAVSTEELEVHIPAFDLHEIFKTKEIFETFFDMVKIRLHSQDILRSEAFVEELQDNAHAMKLYEAVLLGLGYEKIEDTTKYKLKEPNENVYKLFSRLIVHNFAEPTSDPKNAMHALSSGFGRNMPKYVTNKLKGQIGNEVFFDLSLIDLSHAAILSHWVIEHFLGRIAEVTQAVSSPDQDQIDSTLDDLLIRI